MNLSLKKGRNLVDRPTFYEPKNGLYFATQLFLKFMGKKTKK